MPLSPPRVRSIWGGNVITAWGEIRGKNPAARGMAGARWRDSSAPQNTIVAQDWCATTRPIAAFASRVSTPN